MQSEWNICEHCMRIIADSSEYSFSRQIAHPASSSVWLLRCPSPQAPLLSSLINSWTSRSILISINITNDLSTRLPKFSSRNFQAWNIVSLANPSRTFSEIKGTSASTLERIEEDTVGSISISIWTNFPERIGSSFMHNKMSWSSLFSEICSCSTNPSFIMSGCRMNAKRNQRFGFALYDQIVFSAWQAPIKKTPSRNHGDGSTNRPLLLVLFNILKIMQKVLICSNL